MHSGKAGFCMDKDMRRGLMKIMILSYVKGHKTHPYALLKTMKSIGMIHGRLGFGTITKNDIYNLTSTLEKEGFIRSKTRHSGGRVQKIFTITRKGNNIVVNKELILKETVYALRKLVDGELSGKEHS